MRDTQGGAGGVERQRDRVGEIRFEGVLGERFYREHLSVRCQRRSGVTQGTDGVSHVVEGIEVADQVELTGVLGCVPDHELHPVRHSRRCGSGRGAPNRLLVVVDTDERRGGEGLSHQDRGGSETAADIGHPDPGLEAPDEPVDGREPLTQERGAVEGRVEPVNAREQARVVLVPRETLAGGVGVGEPVHRGPDRCDHLEAGHTGCGAVIVGEHHGVLRRQAEGLRLRVVGDVSGGRLGGEPFAQVPLGQAGACGQLLAGRALDGGELPPQTEPVSQVDQNGVVGNSSVAGDLGRELFERREIDRPCGRLSGDGHVVPFSCGTRSAPRLAHSEAAGCHAGVGSIAAARCLVTVP